MWCFCWRLSLSSNSFTFITLLVHSGWPPEWHRTTASPRLVRSPLDHKGPRIGSCPHEMEAIYCWPPSGRAVNSPRCPTSWVKLCPGHHPPLSDLQDNYPPLEPPKKITWGIRDLQGMACVTTSRVTNWRKITRGAIAADSAKETGLDLCNHMSTGPTAINLTGWEGFNSGIGIHSLLQRTFPLPMAAFANCIIYTVRYTQVLVQINAQGNVFVVLILFCTLSG